MQPRRLWLVNSFFLLALAGAFWGRYSEGAVLAPRDFFRGVDLRFRDWKSEDQPMATDEAKMLNPDAFLLRRYQSPDKREGAELAVIAGHEKRTVHSPAFCMAGDGWETVAEMEDALEVGGQRIPVRRVMQTKEGRWELSTYFYTDGETSTANLLGFQSRQLFTRLRGGLPVGALVRILVPVSKDGVAAQRLTSELAQATLPQLLQRLRFVRNAPR
jgi:EpsI family protein